MSDTNSGQYIKELEEDLKRAQAALRLIQGLDPARFGYFSPSRKFGRGAAKAIRKAQNIAMTTYYGANHILDGQ